MSRVHLLDCTLRDGGYYNSWNFSRPLVSRYLEAVGAARVSAIEMGFRFLPQDGFLGPFAYSTDEFLGTLPLPDRALIGVMVNAKELLTAPQGAVQAVDRLFRKAGDSPVGLVRVAAHFHEVAPSEPIIERLKRLGYQVSVNLMQASNQGPQELQQAARTVQRWGKVDLLYFADSLGNMNEAAVRASVRAIRQEWKGPLGIHTHNNMGQARANSLAAIEQGVEWLDGTVMGMGRGAGNAHTEELLIELQDQGLGDYDAEAVFPLVLEEFEQLRKEHGWGPNLLYYLSGVYAIHPTYVQEMLSRGQGDRHHIVEALKFLKRSGATAYTSDTLQQAILNNQGQGEGAWSARDWARGRDVLMIARGEGTRSHLDDLCRFIADKDPLVVCLNANRDVPTDKVHVYAACHRTRLMMDLDDYRVLNRPLVVPLGAVPEPVNRKLSENGAIAVLDYGMRIKENTFEVGETGCTIPGCFVAAYVMALAEAAGASRILLAGFDGYDPTDPRYQEMSHVFRCYQAREQAVPLLAVTPTTYDVPRSSIYSPAL